MVGTILNQRFRLDQELGRGGMGAVYRATDQVLQRTVAIKFLKELTGAEVAKRIRLEAQITARLLHENIVRLYDIGQADGTFYLVMEEVDGTSFQRRWKHIPLAERLRIVVQVADALDYAHRQGVIHRDVKPGNVLLTATDQAKLSDFGLSMLAEDPHETEGVVRGTPHFMSPEQAQGRRLDHRTDLYALGVILYECATRTPLFSGPPLKVLAQHVNTTPDPPRARNPDLSPDVEALILGLLAKDPDARPASGQAVAQRLRDLLAHDPTLQDQPTVAVPGEAIGAPGADSAGPPTAPDSSARTQVGPIAAPSEPARAAEPAGAPDHDSAKALARYLVGAVEAEPIVLTADERYWCGHYLAYLLGGSRRRGLLGRRPLDERNADRARVVLAMAYLMVAGPSDASITLAASLLDRRPEVRTLLSPVVVAKYLASRDTPAKRKLFRQTRQRLLEASEYAGKALVDANGLLNPGLIPQVLGDLRRIAPPRTEVDDQLVGRWNRVAEVWRDNPGFRGAVLRYATRSAARDPAAAALWPEVVYPLIERARWQRQNRSRFEAMWDQFCGQVLHIRDAGLELDHAISQAVPQVVVAELDESLDAFVLDPEQDEAADMGEGTSADREAERLALRVSPGSTSFEDLAAEPAATKTLVRLAGPEPIRMTLAELGELYREALAGMQASGGRGGHRHVPIGPYRLAVIPSIRGRSASQAAIQGMPNKQIELLLPSLRLGGGKPVPALAVWVYQDQSLAITYRDHRNAQRYICWHAPTAQQSNFDDPAAFNHALYLLGLEALDQLDQVLSKRYRPRNPV